MTPALVSILAARGLRPDPRHKSEEPDSAPDHVEDTTHPNPNIRMLGCLDT